jgi:hypothetical protein
MQPRRQPGKTLMWVTQAGLDLWAERSREWAQDIIAYRAARYALDELNLIEAQAGVMWETPQFLVLNDCVAAAEDRVAAPVRDQIDAEVLAELDYWHRLNRSLKHTRHPARRRWWQFR